jgi:hypothetical protein
VSWRQSCTGSCDDPEVLAFLDHPGAQDDDAADRVVVQLVDADLIFDRVDKVTEPGAQPGDLASRLHGALEDAELNTGAVPGQESGHVFPALVIGDVVADQVQDRGLLG